MLSRMEARRMKLSPISTLLTVLSFAVVGVTGAVAQTTPDAPVAAAPAANAPDLANAEKIIQAFTAKEAEFRRALNNYSFKRDALIQSIGMGGQGIGEYHRVSVFTNHLSAHADALAECIAFEREVR